MPQEFGRRASDHDVDAATENRIQQVVGDTRHKLAAEIALMAANQAEATLQATKEHGEVRAEIQGVRNDVGELRRDLRVIPTLLTDVETLKLRDAADQARTDAIDKLRVQQRWIAMFIVAVVPAASVAAAHLS